MTAQELIDEVLKHDVILGDPANTFEHYLCENATEKLAFAAPKLARMLKVAIGALKTGVGFEDLQGLEPRKFSEALSKLDKIAGEP